MKNSSIIMFNRSSDNKVSMTSLEIAEMTGKRHDHVMRDIERDLSSVCTLPRFGETYTSGRGNVYKMYCLPKREVLILVSGYSVELRARIIDRLEYLERSRATPQFELPDFNDPIAAARAWADARESEVKALETVSTMKPKADYFDELVSRNLLTTFRETARELHIKESQFIKWLLEDGYVYRKPNGKLMPYADKCKLFEVKERISDRTSWAGAQTYITPRGRELFRNNYKSN